MIVGALLLLLSGLSIQINSLDGNPANIEAVATGAPAGSRLSLHRFIGETPGDEMFSRIERGGNILRLTPTFSLSPDERYLLRLISKEGKILATRKVQIPGADKKRPKVLSVLPACRTVPANLLKFYIEFDQPMREGKSVFDHIAILDDQKKAVKSPWRRQEIWSEDTKRLTLWIHPGRVKQGVNLREELGPVLQRGKKYTLVISKDLQSQAGNNPVNDYRIGFETSEEHRQKIHPEKWKLRLPKTGSMASLEIQTLRALDPYLVRRHVEIFGLAGTKIETTLAWDKEQETFLFTPIEKWQSGNFRIEISKYLEDLAGNTPVRVFDTDLKAAKEVPAALELKFSL